MLLLSEVLAILPEYICKMLQKKESKRSANGNDGACSENVKGCHQRTNW
jgi:hypothetical protein